MSKKSSVPRIKGWVVIDENVAPDDEIVGEFGLYPIFRTKEDAIGAGICRGRRLVYIEEMEPPKVPQVCWVVTTLETGERRVFSKESEAEEFVRSGTIGLVLTKYVIAGS